MALSGIEKALVLVPLENILSTNHLIECLQGVLANEGAGILPLRADFCG